jgi:hypothetical protein
LTISYDKSAAIILLPAVASARLRDTSLRRWLARSDLERHERPEEILRTVLDRLGRPYPDSGLGALRMWGQTGERPTVWIAAADPVYLEPRLDHICLHAQAAESLPENDFGQLVDHLQTRLGQGDEYGFARLAGHGYLRASDPIATASVPPQVVHLDLPNEYLPEAGDTDRYRKLVSEVEMSLHDHEVNQRRHAAGLQPINCLWFWGGGFAPEQVVEPLPPLFADEPLIMGYWLSRSGTVADWPGDISACLAASTGGFVAVIPDTIDDDSLQQCVGELRLLLRSGELSRLTLFFGDGVEATILPRHRWRFWRSRSPILG